MLSVLLGARRKPRGFLRHWLENPSRFAFGMFYLYVHGQTEQGYVGTQPYPNETTDSIELTAAVSADLVYIGGIEREE